MGNCTTRNINMSLLERVDNFKYLGIHKTRGPDLGTAYWLILRKMVPVNVTQYLHNIAYYPYYFFVLFVNSVFCYGTWSSFTREELMNMRGTTPADLFSTFLTSSVELLDTVVKGALTFVHAVIRQRRRKHVGELVHLLRRRLHTPLLGIFLSNMHSLCNKLDILQLLLGKNRPFFIFCFLSITETKPVWTDTRLCAAAGRLPTLQSGLGHRTFQ